ncbi:DUF1932 domain-containing protein [Stakelama sp. CBK3Z-3]|uniref:DUF1932 domain-containing protein n=1 Tax=Stakelama flava TaxID=2860338 RepID=A0ABS6XMH6_9SPHN|nr:DUF1932 domain-containing protein [Stakelama flava]MBW4331356.1 DUF1932 domain-containing protein [Stakelama flava]
MTAYENLAFIGFGEAAQAFCEGWGNDRPVRVGAYDRKSDDPATADAKRAEYAARLVDGCADMATAVADAAIVLSVVTADQALHAATDAAQYLAPGTVYADMNSVSPGTKRRAAAVIEAAGGRYLDVAVMAPVRPALLGVPLLVSGPHALEGEAALSALGFDARGVGDTIGAASAVKMIRSIMIKGLEALTAECLLSAFAAGVEEEVLASLDGSFPGWNWRERGDYNLDRMLVHGERRAAEMEEVRDTACELGQLGAMAEAAVHWQRRLGALALAPPPEGLNAKAAAILHATGATRS